MRILLINNGGGGIFQLLPGLDKSKALEPFIAARHSTCAEIWVQAANFEYLKADTTAELEKNLMKFIETDSDKPIVLEVFTSLENNKLAYDLYYNQLKKQ